MGHNCTGFKKSPECNCRMGGTLIIFNLRINSENKTKALAKVHVPNFGGVRVGGQGSG